MRAARHVWLLARRAVEAGAQGKKPVEPIKVVELKRTDAVSYDKDIEPIFYKHCISCHSGSEKRGKLDLGSYDALIKGGKRGPAVVPGKAGSSLLVKLAGLTLDPPIPPLKEDDSLSPEELPLVKLWIDQGAKAPTGVRVRPKIIVGLPPANVHPVRADAVSSDKSAG